MHSRHCVGTGIDGEAALRFGRMATGASVSLHNLSVASLSADYHSFLEFGRWQPVRFCLSMSCLLLCPTVLYEEESWEGECAANADLWKPLEDLDDLSSDKVHDWLEADDPALLSDELSEPEEWLR